MKREIIRSVDHPLYKDCWNLYVSSFPEEERRDNQYHIEAMNNNKFTPEVILGDDDNFFGFLFWWDFDNLRYIEHFATDPMYRGKGLGAKILSDFCKESAKPIILEVEHPEDELKSRRIGFYERLGFHISDYDYSQPSYKSDSDNRVSLRVMTYPNVFTWNEVDFFVENCHPTIFSGDLSLF